MPPVGNSSAEKYYHSTGLSEAPNGQYASNVHLFSPHDAEAVELAGEPRAVVIPKSPLMLEAAHDLVDVLRGHHSVFVAAQKNPSTF